MRDLAIFAKSSYPRPSQQHSDKPANGKLADGTYIIHEQVHEPKFVAEPGHHLQKAQVQRCKQDMGESVCGHAQVAYLQSIRVERNA